MDESKKQKLTLSVDAGVVEKAKALGLNISEITESVLRGFTFEPKEGEKEQLYGKYRELFSVMLPLLKKYDASVEVATIEVKDKDGNFVGHEQVFLMPNGHLWLPMFETEWEDVHKVEMYAFHEPNRILANLIDEMTTAADRNKKSLTELELARRIVEAIGDTLSRDNHPTRLSSENSVTNQPVPKFRIIRKKASG